MCRMRKALARNGVAAIVALISPSRRSRAEAREMTGPGRFVEAYIRVPLPVCEKRDPKGLYAKARRGEVDSMTGVQDPYEEPTGPDLAIDAGESDPEASCGELVAGLRRPGKP